MTRRAIMLVTAALVLTIGACSQQPKVPRTMVEGGDAGGMPRAQPGDEHLNAAALEAAGDDANAANLQALLVVRHGHVVYERYEHGVDGKSELDLDGFAPVLLALASGIAVHDGLFPLPVRSEFNPAQLRDAIEKGSNQSYPQYLSKHLWRRLNASPAWIAVNAGAAAPADCCFHAQLLDWMRVATLLVEDGYFEGKQLVPTGWVARMRQPAVADGTRGFGVALPPSAHGAESFQADDVFFLRGPQHWRLWLVPSLHLAVLFGADQAAGADASGPWDETRVLNLVLRAVSDPPNPNDPATKLKGLVPGH